MANRRLTGSLAIRRSLPAAVAASDVATGTTVTGDGGGGDGGGDPGEPYLTSLAKLFPAEALSALLLVLSIDEKYGSLRNVLIAVIALALVVIRYFATRNPDSGKPDLLAILVSLVSFVIYAAAMLAFGVLFNTDPATTRIVATVAAILWMAVLTHVVRQTSPPT